MGKDERLVLAVKRDILFQPSGVFTGFKSHDEVDIQSQILNNYEYIKRGPAETDPNYKQIITYAVIINPDEHKALVYQRSTKDADYSEKRLQGKYSWGIGGHIDRADSSNSNPIFTSLMREIREEADVEIDGSPELIGYINLEYDVHLYHLGVLYLVRTKSLDLKLHDPEITSFKFKNVDNLNYVAENYPVEEWSRIALTAIKSYL